MTDCCHHWMLDEPSAALCYGKCKLCGEERYDFVNASDVVEFYINPETIDRGKWKERQGKPRGFARKQET